jgi:predicted Zn-ribbon and HTH transcriptional regulator
MCGHCGFKFWTPSVGPAYHCPNCGELQCVAIAAESFEKKNEVDKGTAEELCGLLK